MEGEARGQAPLRFEPEPVLVGLRLAQTPLALDRAEHADVCPRVDEPARADMGGGEMAVEVAALVLAGRDVHAQAQTHALVQRVLVLAAAPYREAGAGLGRNVSVAHEWKAAQGSVEPYDPVPGFGVDVVVPGDAEPEPGVPAPARPDGAEEALDVRDDRRGRVAGKDLLEMPAGQAVLALEEEGAGGLKVDAHQVGTADEDGVEGGDGLVEEGFASLGFSGALGLGDGRHAGLEQGSDAESAFRLFLGGRRWRAWLARCRPPSPSAEWSAPRLRRWRVTTRCSLRRRGGWQKKGRCLGLEALWPGHRPVSSPLRFERRPGQAIAKYGPALRFLSRWLTCCYLVSGAGAVHAQRRAERTDDALVSAGRSTLPLTARKVPATPLGGRSEAAAVPNTGLVPAFFGHPCPPGP